MSDVVCGSNREEPGRTDLVGQCSRPRDPVVADLERPGGHRPRRVDQAHRGLDLRTELHRREDVPTLTEDAEGVDQCRAIVAVDEETHLRILASSRIMTGDAAGDVDGVDQPDAGRCDHEVVEGVCRSGKANVVEHSAHPVQFAFEVARQVAVSVAAEDGSAQPCRCGWSVCADDGNANCARWVVAQSRDHAHSSA